MFVLNYPGFLLAIVLAAAFFFSVIRNRRFRASMLIRIEAMNAKWGAAVAEIQRLGRKP